MPQREITQFQDQIAALFRRLYPHVEVKTEWSAFLRRDGLYAPRVDVAVGPFATNESYIEEYHRLMHSSQRFIKHLVRRHLANVRAFQEEIPEVDFDTLKYKNPNARSLFVVEIENQVSRKHLMGSAINASALGRIGIIIGWTDEKHRAILKLRRYFEFLTSVGKNSFNTANLLVLKPGQLRSCLIDATS